MLVVRHACSRNRTLGKQKWGFAAFPSARPVPSPYLDESQSSAIERVHRGPLNGNRKTQCPRLPRALSTERLRQLASKVASEPLPERCFLNRNPTSNGGFGVPGAWPDGVQGGRGNGRCRNARLPRNRKPAGRGLALRRSPPERPRLPEQFPPVLGAVAGTARKKERSGAPTGVCGCMPHHSVPGRHESLALGAPPSAPS